MRVRYDNGLTITANQAKEPLRAGSHRLGQYGWVAEGAGVTAWTAQRNKIVVDYAETADSVFANARPARDWNLSSITRIRPGIDRFEVVGPRLFRVTYAWQVNETVPRNYSCFVHFGRKGSSESDILFQQDHALAVPTSHWKPGRSLQDGPHEVRVPENLPDGDYAWTIGLFTPVNGRLMLDGVEDGAGRIGLGTLRVSDGGRKLVFFPESKSVDRRSAIYLEHLNQEGKIIDFGPVRTDGSALILRDGSQWVRGRSHATEPSHCSWTQAGLAGRLRSAVSVAVLGPSHLSPRVGSGNFLWTVPASTSGTQDKHAGSWVSACSPGNQGLHCRPLAALNQCARKALCLG